MKPKPKVAAASLTTLVAAVIVFALGQLGVDIPQEVALGLAGGALTALGGGWVKKESAP